jgi:hypothetical protein
MANVVITTGNSTVTIDFNAVSAVSTVKKSKWRYDAIPSVFLLHNDAAVVVRTHGKDFPFSFNGVNGLPVDSVDGVAPTSNEHLYHLISGVIG